MKPRRRSKASSRGEINLIVGAWASVFCDRKSICVFVVGCARKPHEDRTQQRILDPQSHACSCSTSIGQEKSDNHAVVVFLSVSFDLEKFMLSLGCLTRLWKIWLSELFPYWEIGDGKLRAASWTLPRPTSPLGQPPQDDHHCPLWMIWLLCRGFLWSLGPLKWSSWPSMLWQ